MYILLHTDRYNILVHFSSINKKYGISALFFKNIFYNINRKEGEWDPAKCHIPWDAEFVKILPKCSPFFQIIFLGIYGFPCVTFHRSEYMFSIFKM